MYYVYYIEHMRVLSRNAINPLRSWIHSHRSWFRLQLGRKNNHQNQKSHIPHKIHIHHTPTLPHHHQAPFPKLAMVAMVVMGGDQLTNISPKVSSLSLTLHRLLAFFCLVQRLQFRFCPFTDVTVLLPRSCYFNYFASHSYCFISLFSVLFYLSLCHPTTMMVQEERSVQIVLVVTDQQPGGEALGILYDVLEGFSFELFPPQVLHCPLLHSMAKEVLNYHARKSVWNVDVGEGG